ncbi:signal peptide peptidase 36k type : Signal peptide peptidase SppA, 36K type OS=Isosphaera pallida (strain ATCC 43644 / DSM 9630 / IS1B) GN=Isop_2117 PE=4 SV=1: Peptidase_S49 [Gemmataceae bacterium]|nr:signal peptide peptidase 36k type : Signal peptide peptidase SppA, 36K type OS=Isosphaera pallida (strain ATCC 43644 / DSM 9630 / IS1B) GN=Isop_2117 PE=4 SV=1: Peptidase_S49 [Gemmataceae bacterium]VTU00504.1 signal peptide peptidase 36k type : Signal peptide peptidase SppA, 36K type OS=Isosphaera pallida (strain ATCC 43644 / DSM 9630 / IS1B) GN=Isop_2117 PE=4 SV=1: Peptidase_S49 [Gemmataceae bacterium]
MRRLVAAAVGMILVCGCQRFTVRTESKVSMTGPLETRVTAEMPPVNPHAGPVKPVVVQAGSGRVAIVDIDGLILNAPFVGPLSVGENPVALFREKLDAVECDPCVRAVVVRVHSPGGGVAACTAMRRDLERFKERTKLPVVAALLDVAAGGAYYVASAADVVVAEPAAVTGGLGVILNLFNLQDLMAQFNVIPQPIKAGEMVDIGSSARPLKEAEKQLLQAMADEFHKQIQADVARSRPRADAARAFDGRIMTGRQAVDAGLVDRVGDLDEALQLAAGINQSNGAAPRPEVVLYRRANDPARTVYAVTPNVPLQGAGILPNLPGLDRSKLPTFLSVWQPELTMEKLGGK